MIRKLQEILKQLTNSGLFALKTGTEVEDMNFDEISFLKEISNDIVPLHVKIGGPEARNDIRFLLSIQVDTIIAPMIESPYALSNFINTLEELEKQHRYKVNAGINIETITGYMQIDAILNSISAKRLHKITAARTDLSGSLGVEPDHPRVIEICKEIINYCKRKNIYSSLGGSIQPSVIEYLISEIASDFINTRHMVIYRKTLQKNPVQILIQNLTFEVELYEYLSHTKDIIRSQIHKKRYETLINRINKMN